MGMRGNSQKGAYKIGQVALKEKRGECGNLERGELYLEEGNRMRGIMTAKWN
jgi:hypothetical protein